MLEKGFLANVVAPPSAGREEKTREGVQEVQKQNGTYGMSTWKKLGKTTTPGHSKRSIFYCTSFLKGLKETYGWSKPTEHTTRPKRGVHGGRKQPNQTTQKGPQDTKSDDGTGNAEIESGSLKAKLPSLKKPGKY